MVLNLVQPPQLPPADDINDLSEEVPQSPQAKSAGQTIVGKWIKRRLYDMMKDMADKYSGGFQECHVEGGRTKEQCDETRQVLQQDNGDSLSG